MTRPAEDLASSTAPGPVLALFDLDHTLIPFDSGMAWTRFLIGRGLLPAEAEMRYLGFASQYVAGTLDIHEMHASNLAPLVRHPLSELRRWQGAFEVEMAGRIPQAMRALVRSHVAAGHHCAIVTATTRLIAEPLARLFGVRHLLCTEAGQRTDEAGVDWIAPDIVGRPCFREHKIEHVERWLAVIGAPPLAEAGHSVFYSDSASDLPLLEAVREPVAVRPDPRLREIALARGWRVMD
ncbi:HAD family hydrolase [Leptothrix discophora]|uniref:HAD family phosphatase n=1 Tax=Leptothrix discophora TaxID=89 RepID=A0ABT9G8D6_LEPDI|nr:HAD family phosphatase [Leptothrix discophora]MDP4302754.1 HAD family phosphatase [Leptothrix discophora]